jgi:pimeloyl-ACP methyl ester carboxylesterase
MRQAVIVGHDWGATVAWNAALLRPDMFRAVAAMSVPYRPRDAVPHGRFFSSPRELSYAIDCQARLDDSDAPDFKHKSRHV